MTDQFEPERRERGERDDEVDRSGLRLPREPERTPRDGGEETR